MRRAAIVLQARMGSSRLPGKVMELLDNRPLIAHCVDRLRARLGPPIVLATTTRADDDALAECGRRLGVEVVRGETDDVLGRFAEVVRRFELEVLVRATGDNPAVDIDAPLRTLGLLERTGADHVVEHGLPVGSAVEAVSAAALLASDEMIDDPYDREHVTPFMRRDCRFVALSAIAPGELRAPHLRLTVDTPDDLDWMRRVVDAFGDTFDSAPLGAIIACATRLRAAGDAGSGTRGAR